MKDRFLGLMKAFRVAFPYTLPIFTGYLFIGTAFGVMFAQKSYGVEWATLMSVTVYAGAGQYLATNFFIEGVSLIHICFLTLMVNIRHIFYGISLLEPFSKMGKMKWYMAFTLTDETYSLLCTTRKPECVSQKQFLFAIAFLDHFYWIAGSIIGSLMGTLIPFDATGIDFAMTALFVVILVEQWMNKENRFPICLGLITAAIMLVIIGPDAFILPTMLIIILFLIIGRGRLDKSRNEVADV